MSSALPIQRSLVPSLHPAHYLMHKYWARKPHNIVRAYIEHFSEPNDIILDPFSGSGVTLIEALTSKRKAIAIDINPIASLITEISVEDFNKTEVEKNFKYIQNVVNPSIEKLYTTKCLECNSDAIVNFYVWENIGICNNCSNEVYLGSEKRKGSKYICEFCGKLSRISSQDVVGERLVSVNYSCTNCNHRKSRIKVPDDFDFNMVEDAKSKSFDTGIQNNQMYKNRRTLIHENVTVESFFTKRNLYCLSLIRNTIYKINDPQIVRLFEITFTSGIAQASRLIPFRNNLTTGGPAWTVPGFWVPNVHLEMNPWNCFKNRFNKVMRGKIELTQQMKGNKYSPAKSFQDLSGNNNAWIINSSSSELKQYIPDSSIDYIFTDPPYGDSVPYLEFSAIWNAWLNRRADYDNEIIISDSHERNKNLDNYHFLLKKVFEECYRVLKPGCWLSLTFNNRDLTVWESIVTAATEAKFRLVNSVYQAPAVIPTKAQLAKAGSTTGDIILNFKKPDIKDALVKNTNHNKTKEVILNTAEKILGERGGLASTDELLRGVILSLLLENQFQDLPNESILSILKTRFVEKNSVWRFRDDDMSLVQNYPQINDIIYETVLNCKENKIKDKREVIAEVFTVLQGSQTPPIKLILSIYNDVFKGKKMENKKKQLAMF